MMVVLVGELGTDTPLIASRQREGLDQHDEIWEGTYVVSPAANNEHQELVSKLTMVFGMIIDLAGLGRTFPGVNISDREVNWHENYRVPDLAIFLNQTQARDLGTHWVGGPDFAVEVVSPGDRSWEKLPFYSQVGVRELLFIDRDPWRLELYRLQEGILAPAGASELPDSAVLESRMLPVRFRVTAGAARPVIEVAQGDSRQAWLV
ncbi:MAG: Uma2 family endonuclease [Planctomycetales bacterium]